jgi:hypothetical protein
MGSPRSAMPRRTSKDSPAHVSPRIRHACTQEPSQAQPSHFDPGPTEWPYHPVDTAVMYTVRSATSTIFDTRAENAPSVRIVHQQVCRHGAHSIDGTPTGNACRGQSSSEFTVGSEVQPRGSRSPLWPAWSLTRSKSRSRSDLNATIAFGYLFSLAGGECLATAQHLDRAVS